MPVAGIRPLRVLYGPGVGDKPFFDGPMGAAFGADRSVYVADTGNNRIVVFDSEGRYLRQWGGLGLGKAGAASNWEPGLFNYPTDVEVDEQGDVYVADFLNNQIQVFDADGGFLRVFPDRNERLGKGASGQGGTGLAVTSVSVRQGRVYATDRYQVVQFSKFGDLMAQSGRPGSGDGEFDHLNGVTVNSNSMVVVSDFNNNRLVGLSPSGMTMWTFGQPMGFDLSNKDYEIEGPRGLTATDDGAVLVSDALRHQLVEVSAAGELGSTFGARGADPGELNFPTDVDAMGERLLIAEKGNNRVQIVQLVGR